MDQFFLNTSYSGDYFRRIVIEAFFLNICSQLQIVYQASRLFLGTQLQMNTYTISSNVRY